MKYAIKKSRKVNGFTLVELLIVIIIIGTLAGMMMLSVATVKDKAEATKIVSNLRNIKAAAMMYYFDNSLWPSADVDLSVTNGLSKYIDQTLPGYTLKSDGISVSAQADGTSMSPTWGYGSGIAEKLTVMEDISSITVSGDIVTMKVR